MEKPNDATSDRRLETRLIGSVKVYVETVAAVPGGNENAEVLLCKTLDLSANGLQVELGQPLLVGSILPIYIETGHMEMGVGDVERSQSGNRDVGDQANFCLSGEVRWVRRTAAEGVWQIGFQLYDSEQTSILEWKKYIASQL